MTLPSSSRRKFLTFVGLGGSAALLAACQPSAPASPAAPAAQSPAAPPPAAGASPAASPAIVAAPSDKRWDDLVAAAKREGHLVISGPPNPDTRVAIPEAFKKRFGLDVEYIAPGSTSTLLTRIELERSADQYTMDAIMGGAQSLYTTGYDKKMYDPIPPILVHPEVTDPSKWTVGRIWYMDPEQQYILRLSNYVSSPIAVNSQAIKAGDIKSWKDLLDPKYRGKISVYDPTRPGTGWNTAQYLVKELGEEYVTALYQGQQPYMSADSRDLADRVGRGSHPISLGLGSNDIERLKEEGVPVEVIDEMADGAGAVTAGFGLGVLMNRAPHPKAAQLFINWMASREGQEVWHRAEKTVSIRTDLANEWAPPYTVPKKGANYFDTFDWDFTVTSRSTEGIGRIKQLTGM